jgi:hypothetical protein
MPWRFEGDEQKIVAEFAALMEEEQQKWKSLVEAQIF